MKSAFTLALTALIVITMTTSCRNTKPRQYKTGAYDQLDQNDEWLDGDTPLTGKPFADIGEPVPSSETGLEHIYFDHNAQNIGNSQTEKVRRAAELLAHNPDLVIVSEGHCDERGTSEYNITLGENRALTVRDLLIAYGVSPARLQTLSYGKERPADPAHNSAAWSKNRRVEFAVYRLNQPIK